MFDFLKRKKFIERNKSIELALNSFSLLSPKYDYIIKQLNDGIIVSEKIDNSVFTNYISFSFDIKLLNKYENKNGDYFMIKGIKFYDINEHIFLDICFYIGYGILLGYSTPQAKKIYPDVQKIDVEAHYLELFPNRDYDIVKTLFTKEELLFISSNDVYEVEFEGNKLPYKRFGRRRLYCD